MGLSRKTPLKASKPLRPMSDRRRAELAGAGVVNPRSTLRSASPLARKPMLRTAAPVKAPRTASNPTAATVALVVERDGGCARCGTALNGVRGEAWSVHHRKLRSQGGDHSPANLVALCGHGTAGCHGFAHAHPRRARMEGGWILRSTDDPAVYPVLHARLGLVFLAVDGGYTRTLAGAA